MKKLFLGVFILVLLIGNLVIISAEHDTIVPEGMTWEEFQKSVEKQEAGTGFFSIFNQLFSTSSWETCERSCGILGIVGDCSVCPKGYKETDCAWHPDQMSVNNPWTSASDYCIDIFKPDPDYNKQCYCVAEEEPPIVKPPIENEDSGNCNVDSGYDSCHYNSYEYGDASSYAEVQKSQIQGNYKMGYYVGSTFMRYKMVGTKFYSGINKVDWPDCNEEKCSGLSTINSNGNFILTSNPGDTWTDCLYFTAWDFEDRNYDWAWVSKSVGRLGSGNCYNIKQIECYDDSDCGSNLKCDKSGNWNEWSCEEYESKFSLGENQLVALESFSGGSTISKLSMRYPVIEFIGILPAVVIDASDNSVTTSSQIYDNLNKGDTLQIPTDQVWGLFYVIENNYQLPTICDIVDVNTGQCAKVNPGITTVCSEGQFDPSLGLCVIQPESRVICPEGGRFDVSQNACIFNPPLQAVCPSGSIYNVNTEKCSYTPSSEAVCQSGTTYNSATDKCEYTPEQAYICQDEFIYNSATDRCESLLDAGYFVCRSKFQYNLETKRCEVYPESQINCPGGYAYDITSDKCIRYPDERVICPIGAIYNSATDKCEYSPPSEAVCPPATTYNSATDKCEYTPSEAQICQPGFDYNSATDKCEKFPSQEFVCQVGFIYNPTTDKCELKPAEQIICGIGNYDGALNLCIYEPQLSTVCSKGILTDIGSGNYACIYTPESIERCPTGTNYNSVIDKCEYTPSSEAVCQSGTTYNSATDKCEYTPSESYVCQSGFTYNLILNKCEYYPVTDFICEGGFNYNSITNKCEIEVQIACVQGSYDAEKEACVYSPNMEYLCINGELTYDGDEAMCLIHLEQSIICPRGSTYDETLDKCVNYPDYWSVGDTDSGEELKSFWENYKIPIIIIGGFLFLLILFGGKKRR